ncbi:MAG TPA: choice-of-anchor D domain-containing protein [Candidatus Acidoferrales bacterium]|nr:choice-of-anchor D domain-containing protein [Candidatus Acidoferrales bacterium]
MSFHTPQACAAGGQLLLTPNTVQFGQVNVDTTSSMPVTMKNVGNAPIIINNEIFRASASIIMSGFKLPVTLSVGQSLTFVMKFAPTVVGAQSGYVLFLSNAAHIGFSLVINGSGVQPSVSAVPTSASFGSVPVGASTSQTIQLKNAGTTPLTISAATASGTGFSVSGLTLPVALSAGTAATLTIKFSPKSAGAVSGAATVTGSSSVSVPISGTGVSDTTTLSASATTENFGNVTVGSSATATVNLKNTGNSAVTISTVSSAGTGVSASGAAEVILSPGQATALSVKFAPTKAGAVTGSVTVASNASNSPVTIAVSGDGVAPPSTYSVNLSWAPSASSGVSGYDVYRSKVSGGPYTQIGSASTVDYTDSSVQANTEYFYVITSVEAGVQSGYSSQIAVSIP